MEEWKKELLYGSVENYNKAQEIEITFPLKMSGYLASYSIDLFNQDTIQKAVKTSGLKGKITKIQTGQAGEALIKLKTPFGEIVEINKDLDPVVSDNLINPILETDYRLSSYMFLVEIGENVLKIIPKNPFNIHKL